ncbi:hypothetical protein [Nostoc sp. MG11]|uniref:hypothetical protein n=1 Tax=Nostoc sp. MG11 TaxID=2721166 RepID=UPI001868BC63|nr:hypothetical protein [Nostoc sp. MG11]
MKTQTDFPSLNYCTWAWVLLRAFLLALIASIPSILILMRASADLPWCRDREEPGTPPKCRPITVLPESRVSGILEQQSISQPKPRR